MVVVRMSRQGSKKRPFYRIVAADKRRARDGRFIELLGTYDPRTKAFRLDAERYAHWLSTGAQASGTVASLVRREKRAAAAAA
ncbi:MAG: 30S ribosomal protein S16 [Kofleriaceae bacterium]|nr:30S ribosomal protein S16 [Myxococcales bacterium]MCB9572614.1 30S ribosomal protein S16 [Kofleriaceae bacterium]